MNTTGQKFGGRKQGTPNKLTKELRTVLKNLFFEELEQLKDHLSKLEPKERIEILIKLAPYVLPKIDSIHCEENEPDIYGWE